MLPAIFFVLKLGQPLLIEGPPGSGRRNLRVRSQLLQKEIERLQCYVGIDEDKAIGKFGPALQRLFLETQGNLW